MVKWMVWYVRRWFLNWWLVRLLVVDGSFWLQIMKLGLIVFTKKFFFNYSQVSEHFRALKTRFLHPMLYIHHSNAITLVLFMFVYCCVFVGTVQNIYVVSPAAAKSIHLKSFEGHIPYKPLLFYETKIGSLFGNLCLYRGIRWVFKKC